MLKIKSKLQSIGFLNQNLVNLMFFIWSILGTCGGEGEGNGCIHVYIECMCRCLGSYMTCFWCFWLIETCKCILLVLLIVLTGELATAIRKYTDLKFGTYHSLFEFFNPLYLRDKSNNFSTNDYVAVSLFLCVYASNLVSNLMFYAQSTSCSLCRYI